MTGKHAFLKTAKSWENYSLQSAPPGRTALAFALLHKLETEGRPHTGGAYACNGDPRSMSAFPVTTHFGRKMRSFRDC